MGLSNAPIVHKLVKKTLEAFCTDVPLIKSKSMQDKKKLLSCTDSLRQVN